MSDDRHIRLRLLDEEYYTACKGVFDEDDTRVRRCKAALRKLSDSDRRLFILYADTGSVRKLSQMLGVSKSTVQNRVSEIRSKLKKSMK